MLRITIIFLTFLLSGLSYADQEHSVTHGTLMLNDIRISTLIPGAKVSAGYLDIMNHGSLDDRLLSVSFEGAGKSEIHAMEVDDGIMKMRPIKDGLVIPAGRSVTLAPGGHHIMFMEITDFPQKGGMGALTLTFEHAGAITIQAPVKKTKFAHGHNEGHNEGHDEGHGGGHNGSHFFGKMWSSFLGLFNNEASYNH